MQRRTAELESLATAVGTRRAYLRMLLEDDEGRSLVKRLVAEFAPLPASKPSRCWRYGDVTLLMGWCSGKRLLDWLTQRRGEFLGVSFDVIEWYSPLDCQEHPSLSSATTVPLPWPFTEFLLMPTGTGQQKATFSHADFLIGRDDAPSFPNVDFGGYEVLWGPLRQIRSLPTDLVVRVAHLDAWIKHVRLTPTTLSVQLGGRAAAGSRVELLASLEDHRSAIVGTKRSVSFLLPHGLPSGAILLLSINGDWRDHRYLDPAHRLDRADFSWESGDSSLDLATLISTGEAAQLEFKREAPATSASKQTMLKTISAFANADGGTILIGVDDDGTMVGIRDAPAQKDRISNIINDSVHPAPIYDIECIHVENVDVLRVTTQPGPDAPYGVRLSGKTISYYVRRSGTTFPAEPNQVRAAVLARQQQPQGYLDRLLRR